MECGKREREGGKVRREERERKNRRGEGKREVCELHVVFMA